MQAASLSLFQDGATTTLALVLFHPCIRLKQIGSCPSASLFFICFFYEVWPCLLPLQNWKNCQRLAVPWPVALFSSSSAKVQHSNCCQSVSYSLTPAHGCRGDFKNFSIAKHSYIQDHTINLQQADLIINIDQWNTQDVSMRPLRLTSRTVSQDISFFISDIWRTVLQNQSNGWLIPKDPEPFPSVSPI